MLLTSGPCTGRAIYGTGTTSDTLIGIANDLSVHHGESSYRTTAAVLHALFAAYATGRIILSKVMTMCGNKCRFHSTMISNMHELISRKNLALMQKIDILSKDSLRDKIIFYLRLQLSGNPEYGASNNMKIKGRTIHVPLNKSEFAHYLNVNRTSLCRELSSMEKDGLITVDGDNYTLIPRKDEHEVPPQDLL